MANSNRTQAGRKRTSGSQQRRPSSQSSAAKRSSGTNRTSSSSRSSSSERSKSNRSSSARRSSIPSDDMMILKLLLLVAAVLIIFEGRLISTMFSQSHEPVIVNSDPGNTNSPAQTVSVDQESTENEPSDAAGSGDTASEPAQDESSAAAGSSPAQTASSDSSGTLAGFSAEDAASSSSASSASSDTDTGTDTASNSSSIYDENGYVISERIDDPKVVPLQENAVDDSYFSDAVFIGDSRMEGFHFTSGITQGDWLTSVGMTLTSISDSKVSTADGTITVYQGLSGRQYAKIYLMLGANDLGFWPWEEFLPTALSVLKQFHELQPSAQIYVCSCIYVEESKVVTDYVNNANVIEVNKGLLEACRELDYCWYLNLNEVLSNGWQSLIQDASEDGVHLYEYYSKVMLSYMKNHYLSGTGNTSASSPAKDETGKTDPSDNEDTSASDDTGQNEDTGTSDEANEENAADSPEPPPEDNEVNGIVILS